MLYPLAGVEMEIEGVKVGVQEAVSEGLPVPKLLGTDVPELGHLLQQDPRAAHSGVVKEVVVCSEEKSIGDRSGEFSGDKEVSAEGKRG